MTIAATIEEAISLTEVNLDAKAVVAMTLKTDLNNYANANAPALSLKTILNDEVRDQRTVSDWRALITEQSVNAAADGSISFNVPEATDVIQRQLRATQAALTAGRITGAQEADILASYNTNFG